MYTYIQKLFKNVYDGLSETMMWCAFTININDLSAIHEPRSESEVHPTLDLK